MRTKGVWPKSLSEQFYAGGFLHADDIRTLATSTDSLDAQVTIVKKFSSENFLKLQMFSSTHRPAMRSLIHRKPKHFPVSLTGMSDSFTFTLGLLYHCMFG